MIHEPEASRLEALWAGEFGDRYVERNRDAGAGRSGFWGKLLREVHPASVLEVGCNVGANLHWVAQDVRRHDVWGVDVNQTALDELRRRLPGVNTSCARARELPFEDGKFDLVFTAGVLIHQPHDTLLSVQREIVRCSRRWVLAIEYFDEATIEVPYRGEHGALFRRDYGRLYRESFPALVEREHGALSRDDGWDDVHWWLFERRDQEGR